MNAPANKTKARVLLTAAPEGKLIRFRYDVFLIGLSDEPFMTGFVKDRSAKRVMKLVNLRMKRAVPGHRYYVGGCAPCA